MKSNGINPNGGPDPNPLPSSTHRVQKNRRKSGTPKQPAKRRKVEGDTVKRRKDSMVSRPKTQPIDDNRMDRRGYFWTADFPISAIRQDSHSEPMPNDERILDFNEFCSPEMFANCNTDTQQVSLEVVTPRASGPHTVPAVVSHVQQNEVPPAPTKEALRVAKQPERDTVIIAD